MAAADADADGIAVGADPLALNGGTIATGGRAAVLTPLAALGTLADRRVDGSRVRTDPPVARAGADRTVNPGAQVTLAGSGTDPDGTVQSYAWSQVSGSPVTLENADTARASFTAPEAAGALTFRLTVTDDLGATGTDEVTATVRDAPPRFVSAVGALRLAPGEAMTSVTLPAAAGGNGGPYSYELSSDPAGLAGLEFDAATRTLSGTPEAEKGRWTFTYVAHDGDGNTASSDAARLTFRVKTAPRSPRSSSWRRTARRARGNGG